MSDNEELLAISPFLTVEYISQKLSEWYKEDVQYTGYYFGDGTAKGDCYLSDVYRITLKGKITSPKPGKIDDISLDIFYKGFPKNIARRKTFRSAELFRNEINFYEIILPKLMQFQSLIKSSSPFNSCPKVFASVTNGESDFIALEDLSVQKFTTANRQIGVDYPHCRIVLETFAKLHALSFVFKHSNPEEFKALSLKVPENYYDDKHWNWYKAFWKNVCIIAVDAVEKEYPNTVYLEKIKEFACEQTFTKMVAATSARGISGVISHGDSWLPNFLFKYKDDSSIPIEAKMIDFQLSRCASPVLDISFFIYTCTSEELRNKYYDEMLKSYYNTLSSQIEEMGSDPDELYSWDFFMKEVKQYSYFGLGFSLESIPCSILDPDETFDMEAIQGTEPFGIEEVWKLYPIKSKEGRLKLAANVIHAVNHGYI